MWVAKLTKQDWPIVCVTIRISALMLLLKHFITEVLEYKLGLKGRIKFVCVAMCSLVMSLCSCDLHVTSLNNNYSNTLNSSRLTVVQRTQRLVFGWYNINLFCVTNIYLILITQTISISYSCSYSCYVYTVYPIGTIKLKVDTVMCS